MALDTDDGSNDGMFGERNPSPFKDRPVDVREEIDEDMDDSTDGDTDCSLFSKAERETDSDTDCGIFSETERDRDDDPDCFSDDSSVTDDEYDAGPEETRAIVWRHIAFHISIPVHDKSLNPSHI